MSDAVHNPHAPFSPWPHRVAVLLVCVVFPLIWLGGLVTSSDAGMAVPDWESVDTGEHQPLVTVVTAVDMARFLELMRQCLSAA